MFWKKEEQAPFLTVFCFSFHVYVEYSFEFQNPFFSLFKIQSILAAHFINFHTYIFGQKCRAPKVNWAPMLMEVDQIKGVQTGRNMYSMAILVIEVKLLLLCNTMPTRN